MGMKCALSAKCNEGRLVVVESLSSVGGAPVRTRAIAPMITSLMQGAGRNAAAASFPPRTPAGLAAAGRASAPAATEVGRCTTALLVDCGEYSKDGGRTLRNASGMMSGVEVMAVEDLTIYHILKYNALIISKPALSRLTKRLASPPHRNRLPIKSAWWAKEMDEFQRAAEELREAASTLSSPDLEGRGRVSDAISS